MAGNARAQETIFALREQIAKLEGRPLPALAAAEQADLAQDPENHASRLEQPRLLLGVDAVDNALEGGLLLDGMTEIRTTLTADTGPATGFALALASQLKKQENTDAPILWIGDVVSTQEGGAPYPPGLKQFGLNPQDILYASPRKLEDALWLAETALVSGALSATIFEIRGNPKHFGLTESRRLALRAKTARRPLFLLRHVAAEEASSASFRLLVEPAPAAGRRLPDGSVLGGSIGHPVFRLTLEKSRNPAPLSFLLEWNPNDRQFSLGPDTDRDTGEAFTHGNSPTHPGTRLSASADRQDRSKTLGSVVAFERAS